MPDELRYGALFAGYGGLELGVQSVLGGRTLWHSEIDPAASRILSHHWPHVPNLGDITRVDWANVTPVDVITGGSPCQDVSCAGRRAGMRDGTRSGLWASMCDAVEAIRPRLVVWENVRGALSAEADSGLEPCPGCVGDPDDGPVLRALGRVCGDLADIGYDAWWSVVRASDAGAAHQRARVFVFAWPSDVAAHPGSVGRDGWRFGPGVAAGAGAPRAADRLGGRDTTPYADERERWERHDFDVLGGRAHHAKQAGMGAHAPSDTDGDSVRQQPVGEHGCGREAIAGLPGADVWGQYGPAIRRWGTVLGRPAPAPTETGPKGSERLSARFTEWLMGLPDGHVTGVPGLSRNDQLRALGNGVVPQQAALATRMWLTYGTVADLRKRENGRLPPGYAGAMIKGTAPGERVGALNPRA